MEQLAIVIEIEPSGSDRPPVVKDKDGILHLPETELMKRAKDETCEGKGECQDLRLLKRGINPDCQ